MMCEKNGTQNKNNVLDTCVWNETEETRHKVRNPGTVVSENSPLGRWGVALCASRFSGPVYLPGNDKVLPSAHYFQTTVKRFVDNHSQHLQWWDRIPRKKLQNLFWISFLPFFPTK